MSASRARVDGVRCETCTAWAGTCRTEKGKCLISSTRTLTKWLYWCSEWEKAPQKLLDRRPDVDKSIRTWAQTTHRRST